MKLNRFTVSFDPWDMAFVAKHGVWKATRLVRRHYKEHTIPFIHDTHQLAAALAVPRGQLFSLARDPKPHYRLHTLRKKNGGTRTIHAPAPDLKYTQRQIAKRLLAHMPVSPFATAYTAGKSLRDNAAPHVGHRYLLKMDITDFFGSITHFQVISAAFNSRLYPPQVGAMLAALCCRDGVLPQGAPTSPALSNIVMKSFDDVLGHWCAQKGITYTRYCDDLTFSADVPLYAVYLKATDMLCRRGFAVNESKTVFVTNASAQRVTGLTVNEKVAIPREYKQRLRQEVYYALRFGLADSLMRGNKQEYILCGRPDVRRYYNHLNGQMQYVLQIEPQNQWFATACAELRERFLGEIGQ